MKRASMLEIDYSLHTLLYRASIYARNRGLARKHCLRIQHYGSLLQYPKEEIDRHICQHRKSAVNTRRRREKTRD